jgi:methyl-accepting chemotaxis protein
MLSALPVANLKYAKALSAFKAADFSPTDGDKAASGADREVGKLLRDLQALISKDAVAVATSTNLSAERNGTVSIAVMLAIAVIGMVGSLLLVRGVIAQLGGEPSVAAGLAERVAAGDLHVPIELRNGDTGSLMAQLSYMQSSLSKVVSHVRSSSEAVLNASSEIPSNNNHVSARTEQQASALEETAASMGELGATVKKMQIQRAVPMSWP